MDANKSVDMGDGNGASTRPAKVFAPGPGAYDVNDSTSQFGRDRKPSHYGFGGRTDRSLTHAMVGQDAPGPGAYVVPNKTINERAVSAAKKRPSSAGFGSRVERPGLVTGSRGTGHTQSSADIHRTQGEQSHRENRSARPASASRHRDSAGSSLYDRHREQQQGENDSHNNSSRHNNSVANIAPEPGTYDPDSKLTSRTPRGAKMGISTKPRFAPMQPSSSTPGPGAYYDPSDSKSFNEAKRPAPSTRKNSFGGTTPRGINRAASGGPGPGAYEYKGIGSKPINARARASSPGFASKTPRGAMHAPRCL